LQYGAHQADVREFTQQTGIRIHDWEDADPMNDLDNFAAQIRSLDLVISVDNTTVHFSGALGTKTFLMLPSKKDWRWAEEREDSYWYPGVIRLFRKSPHNDWNRIIERIAHALDEMF
jgi:ADP-heptose:LPS heptosyltransferase